MTVVFVHGVPETAGIWDRLRGRVAADSVALALPGFGCPRPSDFVATKDAYADWLIGELEGIDGPIDLVGHDWGGGHVMRIAMERPELIRSWATDIAGGMDPEYVWHDMAQAWQTPGVGEQAVAGMVDAPVEARAQQFESLGMSKAIAAQVAAGVDEAMGKSVLALYRSAAQPAMGNWGKRLPEAAAKPGLVIIATEDHYVGGEPLGRRSAERAGAKVAMLEGLGHWWMCQDPKRGAAVLNEFWAGL